MDDPVVSTTERTTTMDADLHGPRLGTETWAAASTVLLFADAAFETVRAGSPARWWVVAGAGVFAVATAATLRWSAGWRVRLAAAALSLLALAAMTAWVPGGLTDGIRILGQPTARVLNALAAVGVALAGYAILRLTIVPAGARMAAAAVAAYGIVAFAIGSVTGVPLAAVLTGNSLLQRLPAFLQGAFLGGVVVLPIGLLAALVRAGLRRPPEMSRRAAVWNVAAVAASLAIVAAGLPIRSSAPAAVSRPGSASASTDNLVARLGINPNAPRLSPAAFDAALANSFRAIEDGEREAPRDRWDPAYVAVALGSDPQRIFSWVKGNTAWIPYHGLLRGPVGVLMDRLGNSLDRAALLAVLLRHANRRVRLAHGSLTREQVLAVRPAFLFSHPDLDRSSVGEDPAVLTRIAAQYRLDESSLRGAFAAQAAFASRMRTQLLERVPDQTARLAALVGGTADSLGTAVERAVESAKDHWWPQVLEGGTWRDFDLVAQAPGTALATLDETAELDTLPVTLRHRVTVRVIAEQWSNGALSEHVALDKMLPLSALVGVPIAIQFTPSKLPSKFPLANMSPQDALRSVALQQHEWVPTIVVGNNPLTQLAIRDTGDVAPPHTAAQEFGGATGGKMGSLAGALDDALGPATQPPKPTPTTQKVLTATWIEYRMERPGEAAQSIRRSVFDLIGPAARAAGVRAAPPVDEMSALRRSLSLIRQTEILPVTCRLVPEYVAHLGAQSLLANRAILLSAVRTGVRDDDFAHAQEIALRLAPTPTRLYALALARFEWNRFADETVIDQPNILTRHMFFAPEGQDIKLIDATDIVANDVGVHVLAENPFSRRLAQGVLDTNAEAILASDRPGPSNAGSAFLNSSDWTVIRTSGDGRFGALQLPDDVRRRIADDLAAGYVIVAPKAPVAVGTGAFSGWWRVNPSTGNVLGFGRTGWGEEMLEYLVTNALIGFMFEFISCTLSSPTPIAEQGPGCVYSAVIAAIMAALFAFLMASFLASPKLPPPKANPFTKTEPGLPPPKLPYAKTEPGFPAPAGGTPSGPAGGGTGPGPGAGGGAGPRPWPDPKPPAGPSPWDILKDSLKQNIRNAEQKSIDALEKYGPGSPEERQAAKEFGDAVGEFSKVANPELWNPSSGSFPSVPSGGASPTAPTLPGTGPSGTQVIPPGANAPTEPMICPGPGCPPSPYDKTQAGFAALLNALGQKGGS